MRAHCLDVLKHGTGPCKDGLLVVAVRRCHGHSRCRIDIVFPGEGLAQGHHSGDNMYIYGA